MPGMNPRTGRWARGGEEIVIAVQRAFSTPKGTRLMRRFLGSDHAQLRDRPIEPGMLGPVTRVLAESLRHEPRVVLKRVTIDKARAEGAVGLAVDVEVAGGSKRVVL